MEFRARTDEGYGDTAHVSDSVSAHKLCQMPRRLIKCANFY